MRKQLRWLMFLAVMTMAAPLSVAGTPTVTVYFDEALTMRSVDLKEPGMVTLYIVAQGFDAHLTAIEYKINYPAGLTWVADVDVPPVRIGTTKKGITQAWAQPINGSAPVVVAKAVAEWNPEKGSGGEVAVEPHPVFGSVRATVAPDNRIVEARGETSHGRVGNDSPSIQNQPVLYGANPNPFNPTTLVTYWIPRSERVRLSVYDVTGRRVATLVNDVQNRGQHTVEWSADAMASGVYFFRLEVADFSEQRKVMLLK